MTKSFFDRGLFYSTEASVCTNDAVCALRQIARRWLDQGYSIREIAHLFHGAVLDVEIDLVVGLQEEYAKQRLKEREP